MRVNLAGEDMQSYVNDANGWRAVGAASADWKISPKAILKGDFEYQHKVQRSVSGYQLLGGTTVPDLDKVYPSTMLGEQSWSKPNTFDTFNTSARVDYDLPHAWRAFAAASFSHSLIDDNVVYAYGCAGEAACTDLGGTAPTISSLPTGLMTFSTIAIRRIAYRCAGRGAGGGPCEDRSDRARFGGRRRFVPAQRAAAIQFGLLLRG